jgi:hypothetical protein
VDFAVQKPQIEQEHPGDKNAENNPKNCFWGNHEKLNFEPPHGSR